MKEVLEEILKELKQAKKDSLGTYRTGDYRIGLTKAESIVNNKLHIHVVMQSCDTCKHLSTCRFWQEAPNNGLSCKFYIEHVA